MTLSHCITDAGGLVQSTLEAQWPITTGETHAAVEKIAAIEGLHHMYLGATLLHLFDEQDIGATGSRTVTETGVHLRQSGGDSCSDLRLDVCREALRNPPRLVQHVAGE